MPVTKNSSGVCDINVNSSSPIATETVKKELEISESNFCAPAHISLSFICYIM